MKVLACVACAIGLSAFPLTTAVRDLETKVRRLESRVKDLETRRAIPGKVRVKDLV